MENNINLLSKYERLLLAVLEEAGEDHISALANTVEKRLGRTPSQGPHALSTALSHLVDLGLIRVATSRDNTQRRLIPLSAEQSASVVSSLDSLLEWSSKDQLWHWKSDAPIADVLLTDSGAHTAREILSVDGWPT
jgi:hypothetical protein